MTDHPRTFGKHRHQGGTKGGTEKGPPCAPPCLPNTPAMPKQPTKPTFAWDVYKAASKARWITTVEAADADEAIEKTAKEHKVIASKLIAVRRRSHSGRSPRSEPRTQPLPRRVHLLSVSAGRAVQGAVIGFEAPASLPRILGEVP